MTSELFGTADGEEGIAITASPVQSYFKGSFISTWDAETQKISDGIFNPTRSLVAAYASNH